MRTAWGSCARCFGGWRLESTALSRRWRAPRFFCVLVILALGLSMLAASSQAASTASGQPETETTPAETEPPDEGESPGEPEAPPTQAERQKLDQPISVLREVPELRTENSDTYLLSNGAYAQRIRNHAVNFRASAGSAWQPIEDQLVQQADGSWQPQASPVPISFPSSLGAGPVTIGSGDRQLSFQLEGASGTEGAPAGPLRVYDGALPDTTVTYAAVPQAVRETLTLSSAAAPTVYRYKLSLAAGLHATQQQDGSVLVQDAKGAVVYTLTPPSASDSSPDHPFPSRSPVRYELSADGSVLSLVLDKAWLTDPKRLFPVTIDPEAWITTTKDCPIISNSHANWQECGSHLYVGPDSATPKNVARSLLYFDTSSVPRGSVIAQSSLRLYFASDTTSNPVTVEAHALTRGFTSCVTWNKYDGTNTWTTPGGDFKKTVAGERVVNHSETGKELHFGFTPQVEQWVRDPTSNHGIILKAKNETVAGYDSFAQSGNSEYAPEPTLEVIYEPRLGIPPMGQVYQQAIGLGSIMSVNVANGNLNVVAPDVNFATEGYDTELGRSYNSQDDLLEGASLGNWRLNKGDDTRLYQNEWDGSTDFYGPDGGSTRFDRASWADGHPAAGDKAFTGEAGFNEGLVQHGGGTRTLTFPGGDEWKFDSKLWGDPTEIVDAGGEGNAIALSYLYSRLSKVTDTHGHTITVTRDATTQNITKLKSNAAQVWKYAYKEGRLLSYTSPELAKAKYGYYLTGYATGLLKDIIDPTGTWVVAYDEARRVASLRKIVNGTIAKAGSEDEITTFSYETEQTTVTNPAGIPSLYYYDEFGNALEEPATQEAAAEFYAAYASIEAGAARADVDLQDHASILDSQLSQQLGANYTGEWFDATSGHIKIGLTSEGYERTVEQDLDNLGLADNADIVPTTSSWEQLEAGENSLAASLSTLLEQRQITLGLDPVHNAVFIEQANDVSSGEAAEISAARSAVTVATALTTATTSSVGAKAKACQAGACNKPLRGGVRIRSGNIVTECTAGFIARSVSDKKPYVMTAGHCLNGSGGIHQPWRAKYHELGESEANANSRTFNLQEIGMSHSFVEGDKREGVTSTSKGDMGIIEIASTDFWASPLEPLVITYGNSELPRNERYGIIGTEYSEQDPRRVLIACTGGVRAETAIPVSGEDCGQITGLVRTYAYDNEAGHPTIHNLIGLYVCTTGRTTNLAGGGPSGSPVYKNHRALGILVAGSEPCLDLYEGINTAERVLHVNVVRG
jgi:hypothetical protein